MQQFLNEMWQTVGGFLPSLIGAILFLFIGWLVALILSAAVRAILKRTTLDNRLAASIGMGTEESPVNTETAISKGVFWLIMLFVLIGFFEFLGLTIVTAPLNNLLSQLVGFGSNLIGAGVLLLIAWALATGVKYVAKKLLGATNLDDRLSAEAGLAQEGQTPLSETLANVLYWFIFLLFLPAILGALNMEGLLEPVQGLVSIVLNYLPNVFAAGLILLLGWFIARIVRQVVVGLLTAAGVDRLGERIGVTAEASGQTLSSLIGLIVYVLIIIPVLIAGLQALQIAAISDPATQMLSALLLAIPAIFGAAIILGVTYLVAKLISSLVTSVLKGVGFDRVLALIGLGRESKEGEWTPSDVVGYIVLVVLMLLATIEAAGLLGFAIVADLVAQFLEFGVQVIVALVIFWLGLYLANIAYKVVMGTAGTNAKLLAQMARLVIIIFVAAMALRQVGIAQDIVNLAFGLSMGAIALAFALAFGLGARELAGREAEGIISKIRSDDSGE